MNVTSCTEWEIELNEVDSTVSSLKALVEQLALAERLPQGRLALSADAGPRPLWQRILGARRWVDIFFAVEWYGEYASLIFLDENGSEYRALDHVAPVSPSEEVRTKIAHGEIRPHLIEECMGKDRAFTAIREFLQSGERPAWLRYRYVR